MKTIKLIPAVLLALLATVPAAYAEHNHNHSASGGSELYRSFGSEEGMKKIVDDFVANLLADQRTRPFFAHLDTKGAEHLKKMLREQFCEEVGGGCNYSGKSMKQSHAGMGVDRKAFNALVEALQKSMDDNGVPFADQNKLLARLAPMYRDIETK